jgi:hypothetical protein
MAYHDLSECTLTPAERLEEAGRIINILAEYDDSEFSEKELSMMEGLESSCSVKQFFWLRDIKDRVLG